MKKFNYLFLAVSILLLTACPGEVIINPDDPKDPKEALLKQKIEALVSPDLMKAIKGMGMPIHDGTNPPNIEGKYLADDQTMKKSNFEDDDPPGTKYEDEVLTISGQNNDNFTVTLKSETGSYSNTYSMVISGSGDRFTLYAPMDTQVDDNTRVKGVVLYSGRMKEGELHDLHNGAFISDKPYFGLGQVYYEADGVAKKTDGNTGEVIEATGETATGSYKGKDMVMKFPSNLQISIKAAKNQDAPHEEIAITERKEMEMFNLGKHTILDFSKMRSAYTVDVETMVDKGLNAEEDIDCSLFTTDRQAVEAAEGRIFKKVDFTYDKATGKLTLSFQANAPFNPTRSGSSSEDGKYGYLAIATTPDYNFETETVTMKAPYVEQVSETCWAACAMMFVRSYKNLDPKQDNSLFKLVKDIGHTTLEEGWRTNFITFWSYDTKSIVKAIREKIGGDVNISCSSFRRTKSAAVEMVKLLKKRHPVILNHGTHALYVIGYKKGENAGATSFLVHDPQGVGGDMYKWIVWDEYLKKVNFNEAWVQGDAIYIIYADRPMLDNPVLQTMAIPVADSKDLMGPVGADLTFTMKAYGEWRKVYPKYDHEEFTGIGWGKWGYDAKNSDNDTIYSPAGLNVAMKVYNADDKPASMLLSMDIGGGAFKYYSASFTCPAKGFYTVKGNHFKDSSGMQLDSTLTDFFKVPGDKDLYLEFALRNVWGDENIEEFDYYGLVVKSQPTEEPEEFKAFRHILKDIYTSITGKQWTDGLVWLEKDPQEQWGYQIFHKDMLSFLISASYDLHNKPSFTIFLRDNADYTKTLKVNNHALPGDWIWGIDCNNKIRKIHIENDKLRDFTGYENLEELTISTSNHCAVKVNKRQSQTNKDIKFDFKQSSISLDLLGISTATVTSVKKIGISTYYSEKGKIILPENSEVGSIYIYADNFSIIGKNNRGESLIHLGKGNSQENGVISLSGLSIGKIMDANKNLNIREIQLIESNSRKFDIDVGEIMVEKIKINACPNLSLLKVRSNALKDIDITDCPLMDSLYCCLNQSLTSLNVKCLSLKALYCYQNQLTSLNVNGCPALKTLFCNNNQLTSLNASGCAALQELFCNNNQLTSLNASGYMALKRLNCSYNQLTTLDVSKCRSLKELDCSSNNINEVRPAYFDNITNLRYDIRYEYKWDYDLKKYVVAKDHGKGYWYAHEPEGGCHAPDPCNK